MCACCLSLSASCSTSTASVEIFRVPRSHRVGCRLGAPHQQCKAVLPSEGVGCEGVRCEGVGCEGVRCEGVGCACGGLVGCDCVG